MLLKFHLCLLPSVEPFENNENILLCIYEQEEEFEKIMQNLANDVSDTYERIAPRAFNNQVMQNFRCLAV